MRGIISDYDPENGVCKKFAEKNCASIPSLHTYPAISQPAENNSSHRSKKAADVSSRVTQLNFIHVNKILANEESLQYNVFRVNH